jgi:hypothetical protein
MAIITISRGSYFRGKEVAEKLARKLGYACQLLALGYLQTLGKPVKIRQLAPQTPIQPVGR